MKRWRPQEKAEQGGTSSGTSTPMPYVLDRQGRGRGEGLWGYRSRRGGKRGGKEI